MTEGERKLAAIMFTDMVGYTALGQRNESLSLALVEEQRKLIRPILSRHNGREVKTIGDAFLVEFPNAVDAVRCAYDIQRAIREFNLSLGSEKRIHLRVGVHVGEVVEAQGDISGDAVNVASRIEPLAEDGGVCVTRQAYEFVRNKVDIPLSSIGQRSLKNVAEPMEIYKMAMPWEKEAAPSQHGKNRIAVLPFASMSPDPNDEYFADGMTEELIDRLAQVRGLEVIARTSVMNYKKKEKSASQIGTELRAGALVEGSVRKAGNRVRVTAQLIDASTEGHLWSSHYDGSLDDIFAVQSEIAEKVAGELKVKLLDTEKRSLEKKPTGNTEAYVLYLQAREKYAEQTEPSLKMAAELFEKAVQLDPSFAIAHDGMAKCYVALTNDGYLTQAQALPKAELAVKKALALEPDLAEAHATLATIYFAEDHDLASELEGKRALELNPSSSEALRMMSNISLLKGELEEGIRLWESAYSLDPLRTWYIQRIGQLYFFSGREEKALDFWMKTSSFAPAATERSLTEYYLTKGDVEKAKKHLAMAEKLEPTNSSLDWMRGFIAAMAGDNEGARATIKKLEDDFKEVNLNSIAFIYYALGDLDAYFAYMGRASEQHVLRYIYPMYCPLFEKGREDPRYQNLLERERWGKRA
ncbi:MAG TPA: adenylate/guanylate cyclase domain-containing protein [Nitrososphaerales archaeon]|nr:adenylate/guanylate cyclase domain-containing protein [Nitrososphaerales archaeon]